MKEGSDSDPQQQQAPMERTLRNRVVKINKIIKVQEEEKNRAPKGRPIATMKEVPMQGKQYHNQMVLGMLINQVYSYLSKLKCKSFGSGNYDYTPQFDAEKEEESITSLILKKCSRVEPNKFTDYCWITTYFKGRTSVDYGDEFVEIMAMLAYRSHEWTTEQILSNEDKFKYLKLAERKEYPPSETVLKRLAQLVKKIDEILIKYELLKE